MAVTPLSKMPDVLFAGMTYEWDISTSDYSTDDYSIKLALKFVGSSTVTAVTAAVGSSSGYTFTLTATATAALTIGDYEWEEYAESGTGASTIRYPINSGTCVIRRWLGATGTVDSRSDNVIALAAINAVLSGRAAKDQEEFSIAGRSLKRTPIPELIALKKYYSAEVEKEEQESAVANGKPPAGQIYMKFGRPS